jgi:hypothetical protein
VLRDIEKMKMGSAEAQLFYCGFLNLLPQPVEESRGNICSRPKGEISPTWSTPSTRRRSTPDASACLCSVDVEPMLQSGILERLVFRTEQVSRDKRRAGTPLPAQVVGPPTFWPRIGQNTDNVAARILGLPFSIFIIRATLPIIEEA